MVGLVGDNGAGKSTLIKILSGAHHHDGGKIGVEGHRVFAEVERVWKMTREQADAERERLAKAVEAETDNAKLLDLLEQQQLVELFAGFAEKSAAEMDRAVTWLEGVYRTGRNAWRESEAMPAYLQKRYSTCSATAAVRLLAS